MFKSIILSCSLIVFALAFATVKDADANWGTYQYNAQHTGKVPVVGPSNSNIKWSYQLPDGQAFQAGVAEGADGTIYAAGLDGRAYAFDPKSGAVKYLFEGVGVCCAPPVVGADGTIYYSGRGLFALNPDFTLKFYYPEGGSCCGAITATPDNKIYVGNGRLHAFDANNLTYLDPTNPDPLIARTVAASWVFNELQADWSVAVTADNRIIYAIGGGADGNLVAIDAATGAMKWSLPIVNDKDTMPVIDENGIVYVADDAKIIAVNPALIGPSDTTPPAGAVRTLTTIGGNQVVALAYNATSPYGVAALVATVQPFTIDEASGTKVFNVDGDTDLYSINATDGSYLWSRHLLGGGDYSNPIIDATGAVYVTTSQRSGGIDYTANLYVFATDGEPITSYTKVTTYLSDIRCPIIGMDGTLYSLIDGALVAFGSSTGTGSLASGASPAGGTYSYPQTVTLTASEPATIFFTLDGTDPTASSSVYSGPISISASTTLKFFARDGAGNSGTVKTEYYNFVSGWYVHDVKQTDTSWIDWSAVQHGPVSAGNYLQVAGTLYYVYQGNSDSWNGPNYYSVQLQQCDQITRQPLATYGTCGQSCHWDYAPSCGDPDPASCPPQWVCFPSPCPVPLFADMGGKTGGQIVDAVPPATTIFPAGGSYAAQLTVTLTADKPSTIYYTLDGTDPTTASPVYSGPISISVSTTLKFFARDGAGNSETVKTESYTITTPTPGQVWGWGWNSGGQLGDGTNTDRSSPVAALVGNVVSIATGPDVSLALDAAGNVWSWGGNYSGGVGDGTTTDRNVPVPILGNIASIYYGSFAIDREGGLWRWGGYYGPNGFVPSYSPTLISQLGQVTAAAGDGPNILALKPDGTVWSFELTGSTLQQVPDLAGITAIASFFENALAVKSDGTVWVWKIINSGEPGNITGLNSTTPTQVSGLSGITAAVVGSGSFYALKNDGTVWTWGVGQLTASQVQDLTNVISIKVCCDTVMALKADGTVWEWGYYYDAFGSYYINVPRQVAGLSDVTAIAASMLYKLVLSNQYTVPPVSDTEPPTTSASVSGTSGANGWFRSDVQVVLSAQDAASGVAATEYTLNGSDWIVYTAPFTLSAEGTTTFSVRSRDNAGNLESAVLQTVKIDRTAPVTTATTAGTKGTNDWYTSAVTVTLAVAEAGSGISLTEYKIGLNGIWTPYTGPFNLTAAGTTDVFYRSTDNAGLIEGDRNLSISIDTARPVITNSVNCTKLGTYGWCTSDAIMTMVDSDADSGIAAREYRIGTGAWTPYTAPVTITTEGITYIAFRALDNAGLALTLSTQVGIDTAMPVTTPTLTGTVGKNGWYTSPVTVALAARDNLSGISFTEYRIGTTGAWIRYFNPITVSTQGVTTVYFHSKDGAGHIETDKSVSLAIDTILPATIATLSDITGDNGWYRSTVTVDLTATDTGSGVAVTYYRVDGDVQQSAVSAITIATTGSHTVEYWTEDMAGNVEAHKTVAANIDLTAPGVTASDPANMAAGVPLANTIDLTFGENIVAGTTYDSITLESKKALVTLTKTISGDKLSLQPNITLTKNSTYTLNVPAGAIKDPAGNTNAAYSLTFTTRRSK